MHLSRVIGFAALVTSSVAGCTAEGPSIGSDESNLTSAALDATFGTGGIAEAEFGLPLQSYEGYRRADLRRLLVQSDGKIVAFGLQDHYLSFPAFARFLPNGALDPSFGSGGRAQPAFAIEPAKTRFQGAALQSDGSILIVGHAPSALVLAKLRTNGAIETQFGAGSGVVRVALCAAAARAYPCEDGGLAVEPLASGKFLVVADRGRLLARFDADGSLDQGFGVAGIAVSRATAGWERRGIVYDGNQQVLRVQSDGRILVLHNEGRAESHKVERWNADGTPDVTFGSGGTVTIPTVKPSPASGPASGRPAAVVPQSNGKILVLGTQDDPTADPFRTADATAIEVVRLLPNGDPDPSFGSGGFVMTRMVDAYRAAGGGNVGPTPAIARAATVDAQGRVVVVADAAPLRPYPAPSGTIDSDRRDIIVVRYDGDGRLDPGFGRGGFVQTSVRGDDLGRDVVISPAGKLVVGLTATVTFGHGFNTDNEVYDHDAVSRFAVAQYTIQ